MQSTVQICETSGVELEQFRPPEGSSPVLSPDLPTCELRIAV